MKLLRASREFSWQHFFGSLLLVWLATMLALYLDRHQDRRIFCNPSYDLLNLRPSSLQDRLPDYLLIQLDDATFKNLEQKVGQFDRLLHAALLQRLTSSGARLVFYDIVFDEYSDEEADTALAAEIQHNGKVVLMGAVAEASLQTADAASIYQVIPPIPQLRKVCAAWGLASVATDPRDYGIRRIHFGYEKDINDTPTAAWQAARLLDPAFATRESIREKERWLNYTCDPQRIDKMGFDVALTTEAFQKDPFRDKIILIGAQSLLGYSGEERDTFRTPYTLVNGKTADGVAIQAMTIHNFLEGLWWSRQDLAWEASLFLCTGLCLAVFLVAFPPREGLLALFLTGSAYLVWCYFLAHGRREFFSWLILPVVQAPVALVTGLGVHYYRQLHRARRLKKNFSTYLSPVMVNRMVDKGEEPTLGGEEVEITAFFSDVEGFSSFSEVLKSKQLVTLMNEYLGPMTEILQEEQGTLDKYIGDAIVGIFNAPLPVVDHALRACRAALRMQEKLGQLRMQWANSSEWPPIVWNMRMRIGLNTGLATVGNMGSPQRFNYTMMGDSVNLAARCESAAKQYGVSILVTEETLGPALRSAGLTVSSPRPRLGERIESPIWMGDRTIVPFGWRFLNRIIVKGRTLPCNVYELIPLSHLTPEHRECLLRYEQAAILYLQRDFPAASQLLRQLTTRVDEDAPLSPELVLLRNCEHYRTHPPPELWDGSSKLQSK